MESLNSKEKSKKTWQFIFIFFALALLPVAAIFFSYFKLPAALGEDEKIKLMEYSSFASNQKKMIDELTLIDSSFTLVSNDNTNLEPTSLFTKITLANEEMKKMDSSELVKVISKMVDNHITHMNALIKMREEAKKIKGDYQSLKDRAQATPTAPVQGIAVPSQEDLQH